MHWQFAGTTIVIHCKTGFCIKLISGSWDIPENITPSSPQGMCIFQQAQLLRAGLEYAEQHAFEYSSRAKASSMTAPYQHAA
jgi:hypothetical protein